MNRQLNLQLLKVVKNEVSDCFYILKKLKIDLGYREFYCDGTSMAFSSNESWYDVKLDETLTEQMARHYAQEIIYLNHNNYSSIIRTPANSNNMFLKKLLAQDMCNSLLIYKRSKSIIKMYAFMASIHNHDALNMFINKKYVFEKLIEKCQDQLSKILQKPRYFPLRKKLFLQKVVCSIFFDKNERHTDNILGNLTPKELNCVELLKYAASDKDIAYKMNVSYKTIEYHISNVLRIR